ncbi:MAG: inorganic phosphate transporter [Methanomicrobiales archaeon]|nr:inorganic phosphate transporter [Methanomicrobiales archaeon]
MEIIIIAAGIFIALAFNFVNGLNDAANSIATVVATRALSPIRAVLLASVFNMLGPFIFSTAIAKTIGKGIVDPAFMTPHLLLTGLMGAVLWVLLSSYFGIPVSSSHALIGGLVGAGIAAGGAATVLWPDIAVVETLLTFMVAGGVLGAILYAWYHRRIGDDWKNTLGIGFLVGMSLIVPLLIMSDTLEIKGILAVVVFIVVSPMLGFLAAYTFGMLLMHLLRSTHPAKLNRAFKPLQIVAASFQAIGHGSNDAQNAMGVITAMLVAGGILSDFTVPFWVIVVSCLAIALGTAFGGWRVVEKMATKITKIRPYQGFCASTAGGGVLSMMTAFGVPVSTTHAMTGSIMGVGATRGYSAVKWGIVREIVAAWILTIPAAAVVSWGCYLAYEALLL